MVNATNTTITVDIPANILHGLISITTLCGSGQSTDYFAPKYKYWATNAQNSQRTGSTTLYAGPGTNNIKWTYNFPEGTCGENSVTMGSDETIYYVSNNKPYAFNPDGSIKWTSPLTFPHYHTGATISPDGQTLYIGSDEGPPDAKVYAISSADGTLKWTFPTPVANWIETAITIGIDGTIYFGSYERTIYAVKPDGTLKWSTQMDVVSGVYDPLSVGYDGTIYAGSDNGKLYALSPDDGTIKWTFPTGGSLYESSPAIDTDGTIYVGSYDNNAYAVNPDGSQKWFYPTGGHVGHIAIGPDGNLYFGSTDNKIYSLDRNGNFRWSVPTGAASNQVVVDKDNNVYAPNGDGKVYSLDSNGNPRWTANSGGYMYSAPAIGPGERLYTGIGGSLVAIGN